MSIIVACACGKSYPIKEQFAGQRVECPSCKRILTVPGVGAAPAPPPVPKRKAPLRPRRDEVVDLPLAGHATRLAAAHHDGDDAVDLPVLEDAPPSPAGSSAGLALILAVVL